MLNPGSKCWQLIDNILLATHSSQSFSVFLPVSLSDSLPQAFSQGKLPKCVISEAATSQNVRFGLQGRRSCNGSERCCCDGLGGRVLRLEHARGRALRLGQTWEIVTWEIAHLESCRFGKGLWESTKHLFHLSFLCYFWIIILKQNYS